MASRSGKLIIGGALQGLGEGLSTRAHNEREDALILREQAFLRARQQADQIFTSERDANQHSNTLELEGIRSSNDAARDERGFEMDKELINLRASTDSSASPESGLSAGDARLVDAAIERHTEAGGLTGEDQVDWSAVAETLERQGRSDLAAIYRPSDRSSEGFDTDSDEWTRAEQMADDWIKEKTTVLGRDKNELADYGGSRTEARLAKTQEFYQQLTGRSGSQGRSDSTSSSGEQARPSGGGTQASPYKATTQEHVDWFLSSAAAGAVIEVNGELYTK